MGLFIAPRIPMDNEWVVKDPESFSFEKFLAKLNNLFPEKNYREVTPLIRQLALHHYIDSLGDRKNNSFVLQQYKELFSDFLFLAPLFKEALIRKKQGCDVWLYEFDHYDDALSPKNNIHAKGAQHFLELPYLFKMDMVHPSPWVENERQVKDIMTTLWTNFAIYGHPNPESSVLRKEFAWEPINDQHPSQYLHIGLETQQRGQFRRRMVSFWNELLPNVLSSLKEVKTSKPDARAVKSEL